MGSVVSTAIDKLLAPTPSVDPSAPEVIAPLTEVIPPEHAESTGSPSSTSVDQDAQSPMDTPMVEKSKLVEDKEGKSIDSSHYRGMIGTLLYLTASRPDLQFAICMCARSKHINIRYHFITEHVENGVIELYFVNTEYQLADLFTKALGKERIEFLINKLGMRSFTSETRKQLTDEVDETMDMTIDQQVALDEAIVPYASRLRIEKSNFLLTSKESTLQLVYDVLRLTLFYKAFLVTADVPELKPNGLMQPIKSLTTALQMPK
nr:retrotransposon protein, putative, unclassified [Tanacetum cinerariifolium]